MRYAKIALAGLTAVLALGMLVDVEAQVAGGKKLPPRTAGGNTVPANVESGLVSATKYKRETVQKLMKALGPAISEQLRAGREVELPGVGVLRVVRIAEYRDLVAGRPSVIPARNTVEFVPTSGLDADANSPGARPAKTVEAMEFQINPSSTGGQRTGTTRNLGTRSR